MELSRRIADFDAERYETAMGFLQQLAPRRFVERAVELTVIVEAVDGMDALLDVMRDLYVQLKAKNRLK